jgi:hypothetical protein
MLDLTSICRRILIFLWYLAGNTGLNWFSKLEMSDLTNIYERILILLWYLEGNTGLIWLLKKRMPDSKVSIRGY